MNRADNAAVETLFVDGRKLMSSGKYQEACNAFAEGVVVTAAPRRLWISANPLGETGTRSVTVGGGF